MHTNVKKYSSRFKALTAMKQKSLTYILKSWQVYFVNEINVCMFNDLYCPSLILCLPNTSVHKSNKI